MKVRITKSEFNLICEITKGKNLFLVNPINDSKILLSFENVENALEFDELIKDKLLYQGFDTNYNLNLFGQMCENMIDKMYEILK